MHAYVYEISSTPLDMNEWMKSCDLPEWFERSVAESVYDTEGKERNTAIEAFVRTFGDSVSYANEVLVFTGDVRERYFRNSYEMFIEAASKLAKADFQAFSGQTRDAEFSKNEIQLRFAYEDKFDNYVFFHDTEELMTMDAWIRDLDSDQPVYFGGVVDYHA